MTINLRYLKKLRCRLLDKTTSQPLAAVVTTLAVALDNRSSLPVATLSSDATGYLSFDLQPLQRFGIDSVVGVFITAPQLGLSAHNPFEGLLALTAPEPAQEVAEALHTFSVGDSRLATVTRASGFDIPASSQAATDDCLCIEF